MRLTKHSAHLRATQPMVRKPHETRSTPHACKRIATKKEKRNKQTDKQTKGSGRRSDTTRHDTTRHDTTRHDTTRVIGWSRGGEDLSREERDDSPVGIANRLILLGELFLAAGVGAGRGTRGRCTRLGFRDSHTTAMRRKERKNTVAIVQLNKMQQI